MHMLLRASIAAHVAFGITRTAAQDIASVPVFNGGFDSSYVLDYTHMLTVRAYFSTKFNAMDVDDRKLASHIEYRPNTNVNFGLGASYRAFTLNLGVGVPALNRDDSLRGDTKYLDAQGNMYGRRFAINLFAQIYRGYYIDQLSFPGYSLDTSYADALREDRLRPDIRQRNFGASVMHILNNRCFSYRAAFNQDAWQRRSAGSWLVGGNFVYQGVRAERSVIPSAIDSLWREPLRFRRIDQVEFGGMGGYAHTFVVQQRWYFSITACVGLGLVRNGSSVQSPEGYEQRTHWGGNLRTQARMAAGYNSARTNVGISYVNEQSQTSLAPSAVYGWSVGNFRIFFVKRFTASLPAVDAVMRRLGRL
ncbi:MAG: DUF4421 domain-containing protein [Flavobacteriales bacterium]|nr:DUF4421 domain-containing protein [Flavobacteriales bacterium]